MPSSREVLMMNGWDGGLNMTKAPQFVQPNETPECLDVVFDARGGFSLRHGYETVAEDVKLDGNAYLMGQYNGTFWLLLDNGNMGSWDGSTLTDTADVITDTTSQAPCFWVFGSKAYIANTWAGGGATLRCGSWDGATFTAMGATFNDDYTTPGSGNVIPARHLASHRGHLWVADTLESAVRHPSRVRWSHVGQPENWATDDYVDVGDDDDYEPITALVPWREGLLVFKRNKVYMIGGWDRDSFFQTTVATAAGVASHDAVTTNSGLVYWVSTEGNVFAYDGRKPVPVGDRIHYVWDAGLVDTAENPVAEWFHGQLWVSIPQSTGTNATFVYDPSVGERGVWTRFSMEMKQIKSWVKTGGDSLLFLFGDSHTATEQTYMADFSDRTLETDVVDAVATRIAGYLRTQWITAGETATKKRWRRPRFTAASTATCILDVEVYKDFNEQDISKTTTVTIGDGDAGDDLLWDVGNWDEGYWSAGGEFYEFERVSSGGSAVAIQLRISCGNNTARWWVDSIAFPFRRRSIR